MRTSRAAIVSTFLIAACLASPPPAARALFLRPQLDTVPIDRLVKNLEEAVAKKPNDAQLLYNLARVHAMAYAQKADTAQVMRGKPEQGAWFGFTPAYIPFKVQKTDDPKKLAEAWAHLEKAIATYARVLKIDPDHLAAKLGHAWAVEQAGKKEEAIRAYRRLIDQAWEQDGKRQRLPLGGHTITGEAAGYLVALLDPKEDAREIEALEEKMARLKSLPRPITPIVVALRDGVGVHSLEDRAARVRFDADGTGEQEWTWITPDAGWLVFDPAGTGRITSALQLFGSASFWLFWETGYDALAALDDDADGLLRGPELKGLAIWRDRNRNGISEPGEVRPLEHWGIVGLSCRYQRDAGHPDHMAFAAKGVLLRDGSTRPSYDLILRPWRK